MQRYIYRPLDTYATLFRMKPNLAKLRAEYGKLQKQLANLKDFATLSPLPGLRTYIDRRLKDEADTLLTSSEIASLSPVTDAAQGAAAVRLLLDRPGWSQVPAIDKALRPILTRLAALYLTSTDDKGRALDKLPGGYWEQQRTLKGDFAVSAADMIEIRDKKENK